MSDRFQRMRVPALPTVLFADASEDYRSMARDALLEGRNVTDMRTVADGGALLAYLQRAGATEGAVTPTPSLIVIDAQLPGEPGNGELIRKLKGDAEHSPDSGGGARATTTTRRRSRRYYDAGANTYIVKPVTFLALVRLMKVFTSYWLETAELPPGQASLDRPWPPRCPTRSASSRSLPTTQATRPVRALLRGARIDLVTMPEQALQARASRSRTTSCWWTARSSSRGWTGCCSPKSWCARHRRRR